VTRHDEGTSEDDPAEAGPDRCPMAPRPDDDGAHQLTRRGFLRAGAAAAAGAAVAPALIGSSAGASGVQPFHGPHQSIVSALPAHAALFASFDVIAPDRGTMIDLLRTVTDRIRLLVAGGVPPYAGPAAPTSDNGILGPVIPSHQLSAAVGMGSSLFDSRYGFASAKPAVLRPMDPFPDDNLDPTQCQGDLSLVLYASESDTVIHALRDITKYTRGAMQLRWRIDGFSSLPRPTGAPRNLLGFNDGIANPNIHSATAMDDLVWVRAGHPEPAWTEGGTYQVIRIIRMLVEFWDRVSLSEQELMIGRTRDTGAPLDGDLQSDIPNYAADPEGVIIPTTAHIRLANPRTPQTESSRILRRGFNYDRGIDVNGNLDQGLVFTCYQQDLTRQFETVQKRLVGEPLVDYISPIGGGYFFVVPGLTSTEDYFGGTLVEATPI
jgi:deferrochelatase/peroxidase EfeB